MRNKLLAIVATVGVAAVGAITALFIVTRPKHFVSYGKPFDNPPTPAVYSHPFNWTGYLVVTGLVTLTAVVAVVIILIASGSGPKVVTDGPDKSV